MTHTIQSPTPLQNCSLPRLTILNPPDSSPFQLYILAAGMLPRQKAAPEVAKSVRQGTSEKLAASKEEQTKAPKN